MAPVSRIDVDTGNDASDLFDHVSGSLLEMTKLLRRACFMFSSLCGAVPSSENRYRWHLDNNEFHERLRGFLWSDGESMCKFMVRMRNAIVTGRLVGAGAIMQFYLRRYVERVNAEIEDWRDMDRKFAEIREAFGTYDRWREGVAHAEVTTTAWVRERYLDVWTRVHDDSNSEVLRAIEKLSAGCTKMWDFVCVLDISDREVTSFIEWEGLMKSRVLRRVFGGSQLVQDLIGVRVLCYSP